MKIARIICCDLDSTLRPTMKRGFDIIPALLPELISFVNFLLPPQGIGEGWGGVKNLRLLQGLL
jgi:hypothetical protein